MKIKHSGLDLAGIIIIYIVAGFLNLKFLFKCIEFKNWGYDSYSIGYFILSMFYLLAIILTIMYHSNKITNYVGIGVLGIFVSLLGGIFILVGRPKTRQIYWRISNTEKQNTTEGKLRQLDNLRAKGIITQEEYDKKRQSIIDEM